MQYLLNPLHALMNSALHLEHVSADVLIFSAGFPT